MYFYIFLLTQAVFIICLQPHLYVYIVYESILKKQFKSYCLIVKEMGIKNLYKTFTSSIDDNGFIMESNYSDIIEKFVRRVDSGRNEPFDVYFDVNFLFYSSIDYKLLDDKLISENMNEEGEGDCSTENIENYENDNDHDDVFDRIWVSAFKEIVRHLYMLRFDFSININRIYNIFDGERINHKVMRKRSQIQDKFSSQLLILEDALKNKKFLYAVEPGLIDISLNGIHTIKIDEGDAENFCIHHGDENKNRIVFTDDTDILHIGYGLKNIILINKHFKRICIFNDINFWMDDILFRLVVGMMETDYTNGLLTESCFYYILNCRDEHRVIFKKVYNRFFAGGYSKTTTTNDLIEYVKNCVYRISEILLNHIKMSSGEKRKSRLNEGGRKLKRIVIPKSGGAHVDDKTYDTLILKLVWFIRYSKTGISDCKIFNGANVENSKINKYSFYEYCLKNKNKMLIIDDIQV